MKQIACGALVVGHHGLDGFHGSLLVLFPNLRIFLLNSRQIPVPAVCVFLEAGFSVRQHIRCQGLFFLRFFRCEGITLCGPGGESGSRVQGNRIHRGGHIRIAACGGLHRNVVADIKLHFICHQIAPGRTNLPEIHLYAILRRLQAVLHQGVLISIVGVHISFPSQGQLHGLFRLVGNLCADQGGSVTAENQPQVYRQIVKLIGLNQHTRIVSPRSFRVIIRIDVSLRICDLQSGESSGEVHRIFLRYNHRARKTSLQLRGVRVSQIIAVPCAHVGKIVVLIGVIVAVQIFLGVRGHIQHIAVLHPQICSCSLSQRSRCHRKGHGSAAGQHADSFLHPIHTFSSLPHVFV